MEINAKIDNTRMPLTQFPSIAFILAIVAGSMDGYAYFTTKTFATFQSGNIILSGYTFATDDIHKLIPTLCSILLFGLGAATLAIVRNWHNTRNKVWTYSILTFEVIVLVILAFNSSYKMLEPIHIAWILAFIAGMQGNAFHKIDGMLYGNIAVTLNVQLAFNYLAETFFKSNKGKQREMFNKFFAYFVVLVGFALGAGIAALLAKALGEHQSFTLIFTALGLVVIFAIAKFAQQKDPTLPLDSN